MWNENRSRRLELSLAGIGIPWLNFFCYCALRSRLTSLLGPTGYSWLGRLKRRVWRHHDNTDAG
jgi:hypothetical protein